MNKDNINFEKSLSELEKIVNTLENGECSLEESITLFEKGMQLSNQCRKTLEIARNKIIELTEAEMESDVND